MRITLLLLFVCQFITAQEFNPAKVFFSNGKLLTGYGNAGFDRFAFKKDVDGRSIGYKHIGIDSIQVQSGDSIVTYKFKKHLNEIYLMTVLVDGDANLLTMTYPEGVIYGPNSGFQGLGFQTFGGQTSHFLSKNGDLHAVRISTEGALFDKSFKKTLSKFFKSCPSLLDKLEKKEFRKEDIYSIVRYFNKHCYF